MTQRAAIETMLALLEEAYRGQGIEESDESQALLNNLASVPVEAWRALPAGAARSIESIVLHVGSCKVMYDDYAFGSGSLRFATPEVEPWGVGPAPRDDVVPWLEVAHRRLVEHVAALTDDSELDRPRMTNWGELMPTRWIIGVMITHDAYHAGEINHLRSLLGPDDRWRYIQQGFGVSGDEPPDWALPSWDVVPADPSERGDRLRPVGPGAPRRLEGLESPVGRPISAPGTFGVRILGVSDVTAAIRGAVRADPRLADLWVEGEIGRVTVSSAGHAYFALKDERNQLQCVWFRDQRVRSAFEAQAGLRVVAHGRIDLFEPQGALQLYVESIQPAGLGDLTLRFEALKARLAAEGLFDGARKRTLPPRPATVAVITSPTGAVWKDICHVLGRRWPLTRVVLVAAQVQGDAAPASLVAAFRKVERYAAARIAAGRPDEAPAVTILARGGGSLEDLWAFNDEAVVRAVVAHSIPVVCGVGHEADVTLSDFAADVRAPTPSAAAEVVVPDRAEFLAAVRGAGRRLDGAVSARSRSARREVLAERRALDRLSPIAQLASARERVGLLLDRATRAVGGRVADHRSMTARLAGRLVPILPARLARDRVRLDRSDVLDPLAVRRVAAARASLTTAAAALAVLGPQATLDRGYAIVRRANDGRIVRDPVDAAPGTPLALRVARGELPATADDR